MSMAPLGFEQRGGGYAGEGYLAREHGWARTQEEMRGLLTTKLTACAPARCWWPFP